MTFKFECENQNDEWIDTHFSDTSPKAVLRVWVLSVNVKTGERYAMLGRAETEEDAFEHWVHLPRKMRDALLAAL